jgi:hypothetical protein
MSGMNPKQIATWQKWVKQNHRTYPVREIRYHKEPATHVSIFASKYYDVNPIEVAQINENGILYKC